MEVCGSCDVRFVSEDSKGMIQCTGPCTRFFHAACVNLPSFLKIKGNKKSLWQCTQCNPAVPAPASSPGDDPSLRDVVKLLMDVRLDVRAIDAKFDRLAEKYEELSSQVQTNTDNIQHGAEELARAVQQVRELELSLHQLEQYSRKSNIEITNVPVEKGENLLTFMHTLGLKVNVQIAASDIDAIHRVRSFSGSESRKSIICKFINRNKKLELLKAYRVRRGIKYTDLGYVTPKGPDGDGRSADSSIYINEHLSPYYKKVHSEARRLKKEKGWAYVWVSNNKIFARQTNESKVFQLDSLEDLKQLKIMHKYQ